VLGLCGKLFEKPASVKKRLAGMKEMQQDEKSQKIIDRAYRANEKHEVSDQANIPLLRAVNVGLIYIVRGNCNLRCVVQKIVQ
jgi:hypothetical protein